MTPTTHFDLTPWLCLVLGSIALTSTPLGCKSDHPPSPNNTAAGSARASAPKVSTSSARKPKVPPATAPGPSWNPSVGTRQDITDLAADAYHVAIGDVDGDGQGDLVFVDGQRIRVVTPSGRLVGEAEVSAGIQVLRTTDLDGDGRAEIVAGWGRSRHHPTATTRVTVHRLQGNTLREEVIVAPTTTRPDVATIVPTAKNSLAIAYFDSKYEVNLVHAHRQQARWTLETLGQVRMAMSLAWGDVDGDGSSDLVVGRVYGETQGGDGDAFILKAKGQRTVLPTLRGVRGLAVADMDGDGKSEIYLGDGWHQDYGKQAKGLLSRITWAGGEYRKEVVEDTAGQYTLWDIFPADIDGDGSKELITRGSAYVRAYRFRKGRWQAVAFGGMSRGIAVGPLDGSAGDEVVLLGNRCEVVSLLDVNWADIER